MVKKSKQFLRFLQSQAASCTEIIRKKKNHIVMDKKYDFLRIKLASKLLFPVWNFEFILSSYKNLM